MGMLHHRAGVTLWAPSALPWPTLVRGASAAFAANPVVIGSSSTGPTPCPRVPRRGFATDMVRKARLPRRLGGELRQQHPLHLHIQAIDITNWYEAPGPHHFRHPNAPAMRAPGTRIITTGASIVP